MAFIAADSYHSTIATIAGGTGITSFTVTSASGFPALAAGDFTIMRLDDAGTSEDIVCTAISGTTVTCLATVSAHAAGNAIDGAILDAAHALPQIKEDAHSGFPVNAFTAAGALVKGTGVRNHGTVTSANCTMTLADGTYKGELCRVSIDITSTKIVTVDPASSTLWDGVATIDLIAGDNIIGTWNGTGWITLLKKSLPISPTARYIAGNFYSPMISPVSTQGAVFSTTDTRWTPVIIDRTCTITQIGGRIHTGSSGNLQVAMYASGSDGLPTGAALGTSGNLSSTTSNTTVLGTVSIPITVPGLYWFGFQMDNTTATISSGGNAIVQGTHTVGVASSANLYGTSSVMNPTWTTSGGTFGTWPTNPTVTESSSGTSGLMCSGIFKVGSVP